MIRSKRILNKLTNSYYLVTFESSFFTSRAEGTVEMERITEEEFDAMGTFKQALYYDAYIAWKDWKEMCSCSCSKIDDSYMFYL